VTGRGSQSGQIGRPTYSPELRRLIERYGIAVGAAAADDDEAAD
jgi:hypothetical protein